MLGGGALFGCRAADNASPALPARPSAASDRMAHPPLRREFVSPEGRLRLVIETLDRWQTQSPRAQLFRVGTGQPVLLWTRTLPQHFGPRNAVVADDGHVLLADEWININSPYALMLIDVANTLVATHDHAAVMAALRATPGEVGANARNGTWMTEGPRLSAGDQRASIAAAGRTLVVELSDGRLATAMR